MIIPLIIMQFGIFMDYWGDFSDNTWSVHIHYWLGSIWYLYLIIQPYFATHGRMDAHRTNGIVGMFIAGGVGFSALSMMYRDINYANLSKVDSERFGPFEDWFFYGIAVLEIVMISAFIFSVIKSIIHRKSLKNHAWWLIATVFIIMMPALSRGIQFYQIMIEGFHSKLNVMLALYVANGIIIILIILSALKFKTLKHPATYLAIGINLFNCFLEPIGRSKSVQSLLELIIKG